MSFSGPLYNIFLGKKGGVADLVTQGRYLSYLTKRFRRLLSENIANHIHVAGVRGNVLIITTSSSAWATRIKLQAKELALLASQEILELQSVTDIKIKIIPKTEEPVTIEPTPRKISQKASADLTAMANSIENDALKSSLLKLAQRSKQKTKTDKK
jgi:hypothetical protein